MRVDLAVVGILVLGDDTLVVAAVDTAVRLGGALAALVHEVLQLVVLPAVDEVYEEISVSTPLEPSVSVLRISNCPTMSWWVLLG